MPIKITADIVSIIALVVSTTKKPTPAPNPKKIRYTMPLTNIPPHDNKDEINIKIESGITIL